MSSAANERELLISLLAALEEPARAATLSPDDPTLIAVARHHRLTPLLSITCGATLPPRLAESFRRDRIVTVDLERTRQAFEKLPWVRKVSVRRKFPWSLEVEVEEQVALASWNGKELVNTHGEVFDGNDDQPLPAFIGQPDTSAQSDADVRRVERGAAADAAADRADQSVAALCVAGETG